MAVTLSDPLTLLENLSSVTYAAFGNTPKPSKAQQNFLLGCQHLKSQQLSQAETKISQSVEFAIAEEKAEPNIVNKEILALCLSGMGFLRGLKEDHEGALKFYKQAEESWRQVHQNTEEARIAPLFFDISYLLQKTGKKAEAVKLLEDTKSKLEKSNLPQKARFLVLAEYYLALSHASASFPSPSSQVEEAYKKARDLLEKAKAKDLLLLLSAQLTYYQNTRQEDQASSVKEELILWTKEFQSQGM
eukprot:TRINITY_DN3828_c0_g1_i1.p1 TRINITY_DN3828_c0_g1~~TRINITY_DN3828_c0_g1_i1.p1  ORF type:complete len:246 (-),score=70.64 TRINITY_DN3828_c0_g1_i1:151-888(-)